MTQTDSDPIITSIKNQIHLDDKVVSSVNYVLDGFFKQSIDDAVRVDPSYQRLWNNLHSLIMSGGKRLRSQMTLLAYDAFGGKDRQSILPIAAAQELLHFSLLIHDDIIDRDYVRYGVANIAGQYRLVYSQFVSSETDLAHYTHSAAILGGDLMLSGAHKLISESELPSELIAIAQGLLSRGIFEVAGGELLDTELSFTPYKKGTALKVATYKTAGYSFVAPLLTGASLAGASKVQLEALRRYATALGIAYQLVDDLLGVFGNEDETGKSTIGDITEGKRTYLVEVALDAFSSAEQASFMMAFGKQEATPLQIDTAKQLLESSGAKHKTEQKIAEYANQALAVLDSLNLEPKYTQQFTEMVYKITHRVS